VSGHPEGGSVVLVPMPEGWTPDRTSWSPLPPTWELTVEREDRELTTSDPGRWVLVESHDCPDAARMGWLIEALLSGLSAEHRVVVQRKPPHSGPAGADDDAP